MRSELVSVITPCYNTGKYLPNLLESVLSQTYPYMEMIVVNDGSTDNTAEIIKNYVPKFEAKGYSLIYVWQENSGQSVAIQKALDMVNGEYLVWPDSDDYYASPEAIAKMVERLSVSPKDVAMVRTQEVLVEDTTRHKAICIIGTKAKELEEKSLFDDCLFGRNGFFFCSGAYMLKIQSLKESTRFPIYASKDAGQNWQLLLPVLYHYRCSTILEPLYNVVSRADSHSRGQYVGYQKTVAKYTAYYNTLVGTLANIIDISPKDLEYYTTCVKTKYARIFLDTAIVYKEKADARQYYSRLMKADVVNMALRLKYWLFNNDVYWIWHYGNGLIRRSKRILYQMRYRK